MQPRPSLGSTGAIGFVNERAAGENMGTPVASDYGVTPSAGRTESLKDVESNFFTDVPRQVLALLKKNAILAYRNRTATFLRIFSSFFFILLIYLVNVGLEARYSADAFFKDYPNPPRTVVDGIPKCTPASGLKVCINFVYSPAPDFTNSGIKPTSDYSSLQDFQTSTLCAPEQCAEMYRTHKVVRSIITSNSMSSQPTPIDANTVLGFQNSTAMDQFLLDNPNLVQGGYIFAAPSDTAITFIVQVNSSSIQVRGTYTRPYLLVALPMQVQASRAIAKLTNPGVVMEVGYQEFAHPALAVSTFEGTVAPLFLIGCAMFPFVIQMNEVVMEREFKLRQALAAMGLRDTSYWLSWHLYQSFMALLFGFFIWVFGCIFQFNMFIKNDFGVVFLSFWLFGQAMVGLAFFVGAFLSRSSQAVSVGFGIFLAGFVLFFMVSIASFPYGGDGITPFSYTTNSSSGNLTKKTARSDLVWEPLLAFIPPTLLIKAISDMGTETAETSSNGIRFSQAYSYCTLDNFCDPDFSIGKCWGWFIGLYLLYSFLGLYCENVMPDAMGVKKPLWYFLLPSYWGLGQATVKDTLDVIEESTDEDVLAEEQAAKQRQNQPMASSSAIEIRGLRATFKRGGKAFHAVKCPWYSVDKRQLFALLGPNGAGKTTTINMLTGFLPPSGGNALVFENTVSHPSGMSKIRRLMGVCPQFDILWDNLSAKEHLILFGTIKGIKVDSLGAEADKRIEEVRLTESANQRAGAFSGGMKRRLSVAVALAGNPEVVYLDEPTTGMDPINRRHVWDVIEAAKQDRCVVLTTHSMEEADILGDRIGIMAKGRLRCLGNSVRLKTRFGEGYRVSISCGDNMKPDSPQCVDVKKFFRDRLGAVIGEETKAYMHFNVPNSADALMAEFFSEIERRREAMGIVDVQLSMSTLEDVFLKVATASELEEAKKSNKTTVVTLKSGENVGVLVGCEDVLTSGNGVTFSVRWGTDENGTLIPEEVKEVEMVPQEMSVVCPNGVSAGQPIHVPFEGTNYLVHVPEGVSAGQQFTVQIKVPKPVDENLRPDASVSMIEFTRDEVQSRVKKLHTPFMAQAGALFRKNLAFQWKRRTENCCLILVPILVLALVFGAQALLEILFLGSSVVRCPYCGPDDSWGQFYCNKASNCVDYFFPNSSRAQYLFDFKQDIVAECEAISGRGPLKDKDPRYCFGKGNITCYQPQWATGGQFAYCPFKAGSLATQPQLGSIPIPQSRSAQPVLVTSSASSRAFAENLVNRTASSSTGVKAKMLGAMRETTRELFTLLTGVAGVGCAGSGMTLPQQAAVCKVLQSGMTNPDLCCLDLTGNSSTTPVPSYMGLGQWQQGAFMGTLRFGVNYWSDIPEAHNNAAYDSFMGACTAGTGQCNLQIMQQWSTQQLPGRYGVRFGSGIGKFLAGPSGAAHVLFQSLGPMVQGLIQAFGSSFLPATEQFYCVAPAFTPAVAAKLPDNKCVNMEEALAIVAQTDNFPKAIHPIAAVETAPVPECSASKTCTFARISESSIGTFYADGPGRWAQVCDFYTINFNQRVASSSMLELGDYIAAIPCMCRWLLFAQQIVTMNLLPTANSQLGLTFLKAPLQYNCPTGPDGQPDCAPRPPTPGAWKPAAVPVSKCWRQTMHPFSIPEMRFATTAWPGTNFYSERAFSPSLAHWWNAEHVLQNKPPPGTQGDSLTCEKTGTCWIDAAKAPGNYSFLAIDCQALAQEACFIQRMANLSGISVGCVSTSPKYFDKAEDLNSVLYKGQYNKRAGQAGEEYIGAFDFLNSAPGVLNVSVIYNDTTQVSSGFGPPRWIRLSEPINAAIDSFLSYLSTPVVGSLMGIKGMPKLASFLSIDFGSLLGPFFFTLAWNILFPTIVVSVVYEKEMKLRVMMRMMGMGTSAYWVINYIFWFFLYALFTVVFVFVGSVAALPSGYKLGLFTRQDYSIHFVFFFLFVNQTIAFAFLWATMLRSARVAQIAGTLWVVAMSVIAWTAWDSGNFFNTNIISEGVKNFITLWPIWGFYRGWGEYKEYAALAARTGNKGLQWSDISWTTGDSRCGMGVVLLILFVEWPIFLTIALYLDQVLDSGHRVPRHPLFFLGYKHAHGEVVIQNHEGDAEAGGLNNMEDVRREEQRIRDLIAGPPEGHDAVMIKEIRKVFPPYMGNPEKVAVRTLTMGVQHGECFGMLGPNGAGKTTTINMLVGFTQPTSGTADVEGFDIRSDMDRIYTLMGVCPQHDILWESLTARQHMMFYGRLKNLKGHELRQAVAEALQQVNLLHVIDEMAGTFSGGMKRRLSVAISMIGQPLCCYLDEPSTGLDPASRRTLWTCIKQAKKTRAIFLTTHSMEEAEGLCDRLGIFVDGALRCIGNPKELTARFGGFYILTVTSEHGKENLISELVHSMAKDVRITYSISGTQKFEIPSHQVTLAKVFRSMTENKDRLEIRDWGIANTTLEEAFIKISRGAVGT